MAIFKQLVEYTIEAGSMEECEEAFADGNYQDMQTVSIRVVSPPDFFRKKLIAQSSEVQCAEGGNVFGTRYIMCKCPGCGNEMPACNACVGSTDHGSCPPDCVGGSRFKENATVHIAYWVKNGVIKFRTSTGTTGSEPHSDVAKFKTYWSNLYKQAKVTYEEI